MTFARRIINLTFQLGQGDFGEGGNDTVKLEGLRCSVNITRAGIGFSTASVQVWGVPLKLMNALTVSGKFYAEQRRQNKLLIEAGDEESGVSVCFAGTIFETWADGRQPPDVALYVSAQSGGYDLSKTIPPTSYNGSVDAAFAIAGIAQQAGYGFENSGVTARVSNLYKPGTARAQIESICQDADCICDVNDAKMTVAIWPRNGARDGEVIRIAADTGLVGYPSFTQNGIQLTTLYNPSLEFGRPIQLESQFTPANGQWTIYGLSHRLEANIPGGQWFSDLMSIYSQAPA